MATTTKKSTKRVVVTPAAAPSTQLSGMSVADIQAALAARTAQEVEALTAQRAAKVAEVAAIDKALAGYGSAPRKRGRKARAKSETNGTPVTRVHNEIPLNQVVHTLLSKFPSKTGKVKELEEAVKKTEFKTSSDNLYAMIHTALKDEEMFRKISRGLYQAI